MNINKSKKHIKKKKEPSMCQTVPLQYNGNSPRQSSALINTAYITSAPVPFLLQVLKGLMVKFLIFIDIAPVQSLA